MSNNNKDIDYYRKIGALYSCTEGSEHYRSENNIEPLDLIIAKDMIEDFSLANIIKYAARYKYTKNLNDLKKIIDYAHILYGVEYENQTAK